MLPYGEVEWQQLPTSDNRLRAEPAGSVPKIYDRIAAFPAVGLGDAAGKSRPQPDIQARRSLRTVDGAFCAEPICTTLRN
jgi:hypothetical protein